MTKTIEANIITNLNDAKKQLETLTSSCVETYTFAADALCDAEDCGRKDFNDEMFSLHREVNELYHDKIEEFRTC